MIIFLDSGPLGLLSSPRRRHGEAADCQDWLARHIETTNTIVVPEIADYEVRRELIHRNYSNSIHRLDRLGNRLKYLQLTTGTMRLAAGLWGLSRQQGLPTAAADAYRLRRDSRGASSRTGSRRLRDRDRECCAHQSNYRCQKLARHRASVTILFPYTISQS